jgi:hypothetical protein
VAARIERADRRPQGWDLNLVRDDLDAAVVAVLEHQFPGPGTRLAPAAQPDADGRSGGVHSPHPVVTCGEAVDNWPGGVQPFQFLAARSIPKPGPTAQTGLIAGRLNRVKVQPPPQQASPWLDRF